MTIRFRCPCGHLLRVPDGNAGKKARCAQCGSVSAVPSPDVRRSEAAPLGTERRRRAGSVSLLVRCQRDLEGEADSFLDQLVKGLSRFLHEGSKFFLGWGQFHLIRRSGELVVCEPAFLKEPHEGWVEDLSISLRTRQGQASVVSRVQEARPGFRSRDTQWWEGVQVLKGGLAKREVIAIRTAPSEQYGFSGWRFTSIEREAELGRPHGRDDWEIVPSFQLLKLRPTLLHALPLPVGYLAHFQGESLKSVCDDREQECWRA